MYLTPDKFRLAHLNLDGFGPGELVRFCPRCDFQYAHARGCLPYCCPICEAALCVAGVTPDFVEWVRAAA